MARILVVLQRSRDGVSADELAAYGKVEKLKVAGFVKILRGEGFVVEHTRRWGWCSGRGGWRSFYRMKEQK